MRSDLIKIRFVNGGLIGQWKELDSSCGRTFSDLVKYMKTPEISHLPGAQWDYHNLHMGKTWDKHVVWYGDRIQFWLPVSPKPEEFKWENFLKKDREIILFEDLK